MGTLFRSQEMTLCQLFLQTEAAYACVSELGELGLVQFRDLNPDVNAFQRKFVNEIRRCDEMERKLRFLEKEIKKDNIPMLDTGENPEAPAPREMIDLEATFEKLENDLKEVNANAEQLKRNYLELTELKHILRKTQNFFDEAEQEHLHWQAAHEAVSEDRVGLLGEEGLRAGGQGMRLGFVAGVILRERLPGFERMLWRACRGNVFLKQAEIESPLEDPSTGDNVYKSVFIIFYQGDQLKSRVKKICEGFRATLYPCPDSQSERREMAIGVMTRIEDLNTVLNQTQDHRHRVLVTAAQNITIWGLKVRKIKAIYHTLNMFNLDVTNKCLIGECWCAVDDLDQIHLALRRGTERSGSSVQPILNRMRSHEDPPTYHRTNKVTRAFQAIVDAYGVARYREINPAPFTVITFPFLFAVMFGDAGHGTIMLLFAIWMVVREKQLSQNKGDNEIWNTMFGGRYIILLMGAFSVYTGMIYNDIFSKSFNIFGSSWYPAYSYNDTVSKSKELTLDPNNTAMYSGNPYPFGIDPVWQVSANKITFTNSVKMKMSVILGVFQMMFGVCLSVLNHNFYNDRLGIFFEFIPQILFLGCIFGYLVILIFVKWLKFTAATSACAPSLLIGLINMFMFKYKKTGDCSNLVFEGQAGLQKFLVILAVLCVPVMLLVKPYMLYRRHKARSSGYRQLPMYRSQENGHNVVAVDVEESIDSISHSTALHDAEPEDGQEELGAGHLSVQSGDIRQREANGSATPTSNSTAGLVPGSEEAGPMVTPEAEFNIGDICVTQAIHTIEYCLGCISNTASYLRLWALSLAHAQLSEVLWNMVFKIGLSSSNFGGSFMLFVIFAFWAVLTIGVLLIMEGLSAFLHALRLHWIEFQNKFYYGTGYLFQPFSFENLIHHQASEE